MRRTATSVSVVIPTLNEAGTIEEVLEKAIKFADRVLVVDGNSKDGTAKLAKRSGAEVIFQNPRGKGAALREAFRRVDSDIIVMMDADASMNPNEIWTFVKTLESKRADIVKGSRFLIGGYSEDLNTFRRIGNIFFTRLVNFLWHANYTDLCYGFAAFRKEALEKLLPCLESTRFEIEAEIFVKAKSLGFEIAEIPSVELKRRFGKSNLNAFRDGISILRTISRESIMRIRKRQGLMKR